MDWYRNLPTNVRPMPLQVTSDEFVEEWFTCWKNPEADMSKLLHISKPWVNHWIQMLDNPEYPKDINYISLCALLSHSSEEALRMIDTWKKQTKSLVSLEDELTYLFVVHVRTANYFPTRASRAVIAEYVIARDFKHCLKKNIKRVASRGVDSFDTECKLDTNETDPECILISKMGLSRWENYLLELLKTGASALDISKTTHIPRETFYYEEKDLWHKLRETFLPKIQ